jgi:hypothetical protein
MDDVIQIPRKEYEAMQEKISLLQDSDLVRKLTRLVELIYEEKYGLYLGDDTSDLTASSLKGAFTGSNSAWDNV